MGTGWGMGPLAALAAFLLFLVQPLVGRLLLPGFGGSPAVWTGCMLLFQALLLVGYAFAHGTGHRTPRWMFGLLALAALALPISDGGGGGGAGGGAPVLAILLAAAGGVGLPFVALATTTPLLAAWADRLGRGEGAHRLYAWSNTGSLLALGAYPLLIEPHLRLAEQTAAWSIAFGVYAVAMGWTGLRIREPAPPAEPADRRVRALWIVATALASADLLAVTETISQDVGVVSMLWVLPLGLYLLTWILTFADLRWALHPGVHTALLIVALPIQIVVLRANSGASLGWQLAAHSFGLFALCMALHGLVARHRPAPAGLTAYYLAMSAGGVLGGLAIAVLAPAVLPARLDLHIILLIAPAAWLFWTWRDHRAGFAAPPAGAWAMAGALIAVAGGFLAHHAWSRQQGALEISRSFYGTLQVKRYDARNPQNSIVHLRHGRISHGLQHVAPERQRTPTTYFAPETGIGLAMRWRAGEAPRRIGVLGLGVGTLAVYGRPQDEMTFFELNPDVVRMASAHFTYLEQAESEVDIVLGDGRIRLAELDSPRFDVLALDAFSGDAVPSHLLTREAFHMYRSRLAPGGILAVNVSNRHLELRGVVGAHADALGMQAVWVRGEAPSLLGDYVSYWMLLTENEDFLAWPPLADAARALRPDLPVVAWTDDFAPLLPVLK